VAAAAAVTVAGAVAEAAAVAGAEVKIEVICLLVFLLHQIGLVDVADAPKEAIVR